MEIMICDHSETCNITICPHINEHESKGKRCKPDFCTEVEKVMVKCIPYVDIKIEQAVKAERERIIREFVNWFKERNWDVTSISILPKTIIRPKLQALQEGK